MEIGKLEEVIGHAAATIARDIEAKKVVLIEKVAKEGVEQDKFLDVQVTVFTQSEHTFEKASFESIIKKSSYGSLKPLKELIIECIDKKCLDKGDKVVCIADESIGIGYKRFLFVFDVDDVIYNISKHHLSENISPNVIEALIEIATEISNEGREGRKVGTSFIVGDKEKIMPYTKQLVLNPFHGYEKHIKITDPEIKETVKEYAQLDGAFIIHTDGSIISSGAYIDVNTEGIELPGLGTRHRNCAALTKLTDAIAFVVSTSGSIRIFKEGKVVMRL